MNNRLLSLAAILAASALVAVGCGGDDSSGENAPTKTAYVSEANGICSDTTTELTSITKDLPNDIEAPESQAAITDEIVPLYQEQITQLRDLTPPEGDEDTTAAIYDAVDEALQKVEDDPSALGEPDTFADANTKASEYGLDVCAS